MGEAHSIDLPTRLSSTIFSTSKKYSAIRRFFWPGSTSEDEADARVFFCSVRTHEPIDGYKQAAESGRVTRGTKAHVVLPSLDASSINQSETAHTQRK